MDSTTLHSEANKDFNASNLNKDKSSKKDVRINYDNFENSSRWETSEPINEICPHCRNKKCNCGGCAKTDFYESIRKFRQVPLCQRCICKPIESDLILNDTGKSLDELVNNRRRRGNRLAPNKKITTEDYENGDVIKQGNKFKKIGGST
jgi:hypothetical protein